MPNTRGQRGLAPRSPSQERPMPRQAHLSPTRVATRLGCLVPAPQRGSRPLRCPLDASPLPLAAPRCPAQYLYSPCALSSNARLFLNHQARVPRRKVAPHLHSGTLFLQAADCPGGVITPTAVDGLHELLLGEGGQGHGDVEL